MTATANESFASGAELSFAHGSSFFWTMIALAVLDVVLLFWILNPLAVRVNNLPAPQQTTAVAREVQAPVSIKRSPLGPIVTSRLPLRAAR